MTILGITGGIATGKSTAVAVFKQHGFPVIDGDVVAREVVQPGEEGLNNIIAAFGDSFLTEAGTLDRKKLGRLVFSQPDKRRLLDQTLDPVLRQAILNQLSKAAETSRLVIADIPLLFEGHYEASMDLVAVVYVPEAIQLERLMARDKLSQAEAEKRIQSQMPIEKKRQLADIVFDNQGNQEELTQQIELWLKSQQYISENR